MRKWNIYNIPAIFGCDTLEDFFTKLKEIIETCKPYGLDPSITWLMIEDSLDQNPPLKEMLPLLIECHYAYKSNELNEKFRHNPPEVTYENPELVAVSTTEEGMLMTHLLFNGVDLPGSTYNPVGMGYYTPLFFHMFFGNYSDFIEHMDQLSPDELRKTLDRREGYGQYSPIFAPIIGLKIVRLEESQYMLPNKKREIREMYHGENENKQVEILEKLLDLGADPDAHDIVGHTGLMMAFRLDPEECFQVVSTLLNYGADPNMKTIDKRTVLTAISATKTKCIPEYWKPLEMLIDHNAQTTTYEETLTLRTKIETTFLLESAVKVREAFPKKDKECELSSCANISIKRCSACNSVYYCSVACQKQDWKFHKRTCVKKRKT